MPENKIVISGPVFIYMMIAVFIASLVVATYLVLKKIIPDIKAGNKIRGAHLLAVSITLLIPVLCVVAMW